MSATEGGQSLFDEVSPLDARFTARPTPPVLNVEPPILLDPPITLDPAPMPGFQPEPILDLPPNESRAAPRPETPSRDPWSDAHTLDPQPHPSSRAHQPRSTRSGGFAWIRSWLGGSSERSGPESARRNGTRGASRRWITATVTVSLVAMAVVGIGRPILDLDRSVDSAAASAEPAAMAADNAGLGTAAAAPALAAAGTPTGTTRAAGTVTEAPATSMDNVVAAPLPAPATTPALAPAPQPARSPTQTPAKRPAARADSTAPGRSAEASRATAAAGAQKPSQRFVVQLAAYKNLAQAREVRRKVESLGLRAYYQTMDTADGRRFRVRVGPFATKLEAERAQRRVATLRFNGTVLTL